MNAKVLNGLGLVSGLVAWVSVVVFGGPREPLWLALFVLYGLLFVIIQRRVGVPAKVPVGRTDLAILAALVALGVVCVGIGQGSYDTTLLVISVIGMALCLPIGPALVGALAQTLAAGALLLPRTDRTSALGGLTAMFALQLFAVLMVISFRREVALREEVERINSRLEEAQALLSARSRDDERLRIARELHDRLGHQLTALTVNLEVALRSSTGPAASYVAMCRDLARDTLIEVRDVVGALRSGSESSVDLRAELMLVGTGLARPKVHVHVHDDVAVTDAARVETMIRLAQEAVTNAARHSSARNVWIDVDQLSDTVTVTVRDDGQGGNGTTEGNGIRGMRERLAPLGGVLHIASGPGAGPGFRLEASIPVSG